MKRLLSTALISALLCFGSAPNVDAAELQPDTDYPQKLLTASQMIMHRITLTQPGVLTLRAQHEAESSGDNWKVRLSDAQLQTLCEFNVSGTVYSTSGPRLRLPPDSYDLRISAGANFSGEELLLSYSFEEENDVSAEKEPNRVPTMATPLEPGRFILGNTQSIDDVDVYLLQIAAEGTLVLHAEANRAADGQHWKVELQQENLEILSVPLDPELRSSAEIPVSPGRYYIYLSSRDDSWSDADYRLIARLEEAVTPVKPRALEIGESDQGSLEGGEEETIYAFTFSGSELTPDALALRLSRPETVSGEWMLTLTDTEENTIWQGRTSGESGLYTALLMGLRQGEYRLTLRTPVEQPRKPAAYELGLYHPEMLQTELKLKIGDTTMLLNGLAKELDPGFATAPLIIDGRTMLPIRSVVESLGGDIVWNEASESIRIACGGHIVELQLGQSSAMVDGAEIELDVLPQVVEGRTMLPLRFVGEALGCFVLWRDEGQEIIVRY